MLLSVLYTVVIFAKGFTHFSLSKRSLLPISGGGNMDISEQSNNNNNNSSSNRKGTSNSISQPQNQPVGPSSSEVIITKINVYQYIYLAIYINHSVRTILIYIIYIWIYLRHRSLLQLLPHLQLCPVSPLVIYTRLESLAIPVKLDSFGRRWIATVEVLNVEYIYIYRNDSIELYSEK